MNVHVYPKESEYYSENLKTMDNTYPNTLSSKERNRKRGAGTSLLHPQPCNRIASGKRMETDGTLYPSNHDRIRPASTTSPLLADKHGTCFPGDVFFSPAAIGTAWVVSEPCFLPSAFLTGSRARMIVAGLVLWEALASTNHAGSLFFCRLFTSSSKAFRA